MWLRVGQCFRYVRMVDAGIERTEVEQFLKTAITKVGQHIYQEEKANQK